MIDFERIIIEKVDSRMHLIQLEPLGIAIVFGIAASLLFEASLRFAPEPSIRYFLRRHKLDFFTAIVAIIGYAIAYIFSREAGLSFALRVLVTFIAMVIIIYSKTSERDFYFLPLQNRKEKDDWIGEGRFEFERGPGGFVITNSFSGFIFSKCLAWSDYRLRFEFKIANASVGAIVRATNLSNLVMLQIFEHGIKPHIRINGFWTEWTAEAAQLIFPKRLTLDDWYRCELECDKSVIHIRIHELKNNSHVLDREWRIPSGQVAYGTVDSSSPQKTITNLIPFPINLEFGTIGFRNDNVEKATVKSALIEKL